MAKVVDKHVAHGLLIRLGDPDDPLSEKVRGAQWDTRHVVIVDGVVVKNEPDHPVPISADEAGMARLRELMDPAGAQALADLTDANIQIERLKHELQLAEEELGRWRAAFKAASEERRRQSIAAARELAMEGHPAQE